MAITYPFRSTPQLGPAFSGHDTAFWFMPPTTYNNGSGVTDSAGVSYKVGNPEQGTDGHDYMMVQNNTAATLAASARFNVSDDGLFTLTANASGTWMVPAFIKAGPVPVGAYFHARRFTL